MLRKNLFIALFICFTISVLPQKTRVAKYHPLSGTFMLTINGGTTLAFTDYTQKRMDYAGRFLLEYYLPTYNNSIFGFKLYTEGGYVSGRDASRNPSLFRTDLYSVAGGLVYGFSIQDKFFPYLFGGLGLLTFSPKDEFGNLLVNAYNGGYKRTEVNAAFQTGCKLVLTDNMCLDVNAGLNISPRDYLDDIVAKANNDTYLTFMVGFSYAFGGEQDDDGDGVPNNMDKCPDTPKGVTVDEFGCALDSDHDGVPNYLDKCPNTANGAKVDEKGCPIDSDNDGVPDYLDLCPMSPNGVKVDNNGCPFDNDNDGVPDYLDKCPGTVFGVDVDDYGCPKDSDNDGVPDYIDKCPDTPAGKIVDAVGCIKVEVILPKVEQESKIVEPVEENVKEVILITGTNFGFNSADLLPTAYPDLDRVVKTIRENPLSQWKIEGYTDNVGSDAGNVKISLQRAQSVLNYFTSKGIPRTNFEIAGLGKLNPIGDNKTESGRAKNRRVKIIRIK